MNPFKDNTLNKLLRECNTISSFVENCSTDCQYISLGQNCSTSYYLKRQGLKKASFPFDWVFSSPEIIVDCIKNNFRKYLDKNLIINRDSKAGHLYHLNFFNHRNPIKSKEDYDYHVRCCNRFLDDLSKETITFYVITLINETKKRTGWASGFGDLYKAPKNQNLISLQEMMTALKNKKANCKFVVIDHYTNKKRDFSASIINDDVLEIKFHAAGSSNGVKYKDSLDDFLFSELINSLHIRKHNQNALK